MVPGKHCPGQERGAGPAKGALVKGPRGGRYAMRSFKGCVRRTSLLRLTACAGASILLAAPIGAIWAGTHDPTAVTRIEQDWELDVNEPASESCSPQFHTVMSPYGTLNGLYFQVTWNYH